MATVSILNRTTKAKGNVRLRFRLTDGRGIDLYHKSEIEADVNELSKFDSSGDVKAKIRIGRKELEEKSEVFKTRMKLINDVYEKAVADGVKLTNDTFEEAISRALHPEEEEEEERADGLLKRFSKYVEGGLFSERRHAGYKVMIGILTRYLAIEDKKRIKVDEVSPTFLMDLRDFMINEYEYASKPRWAHLYADFSKNNLPMAPRAQNTVAVNMKMLKAFFTQLEDSDEIQKSPFRMMAKATREASLREQYVSPVALTLEELRIILDTEVETSLQATKEAFLLQCALGCRVSDFARMRMQDVSVTAGGIPYVSYLPQKTRHAQKILTEVKTPLVKFALDIVKRSGFNLPVLRNVSGKDGYNKRIKKLLQVCGLDRSVEVMNENGGGVVSVPLYEAASSKLARKTNVTLMSRVQIDPTIAGLHAKGSEAVSHYYDRSLADLFNLMSMAFGEPIYKVNDNLDIL